MLNWNCHTTPGRKCCVTVRELVVDCSNVCELDLEVLCETVPEICAVASIPNILNPALTDAVTEPPHVLLVMEVELCECVTNTDVSTSVGTPIICTGTHDALTVMVSIAQEGPGFTADFNALIPLIQSNADPQTN